MRMNKQKIKFIKKAGWTQMQKLYNFLLLFFLLFNRQRRFWGNPLVNLLNIFRQNSTTKLLSLSYPRNKDPIFMWLAKDIEENLDVSTHWREVLFLFIWGVYFPHLSSFVKERAFDCRFSWIKLVRSNEVGLLELVHTANNRRFHCTVLL